MKLWFVLICAVASTAAYDLVSYDEVEHLMRAYMRKQLTEDEKERFNNLIEIMAFPNYILRNALEEYSQPRITVTCVVCRATLRAAFDMVRDGATDAQINEIFYDLCSLLGIVSANVCSGVVELNLPIITYAVRNNPDALPETLCGLIFTTIEEGTCPFDDPRFEWSVEIPQQNTVPQIPQGSSEPLKILFLTDAHIDPKYEAYGVGSCDEPTCCRYGQNEARLNPYQFHYDDSYVENSIYKFNGEIFFNLTFAPEFKRYKEESRALKLRNARNSEPAGYWGDYRACDTPLWVFDDIINRTVEAHSDVDIIYYLGDTIDHGVWETTFELIDDMNSYLINKLKSAFPGKTVYLAIANHESQPTNQYAPSYVTEPELGTAWLYNSLAEAMGDWLPTDQQANFREGGYYTALVRPGFRVIVINTNIAYKYNWWINFDPLDQKAHLEWLVATLLAAEAAGERVHILSHIPPGTHDLTKVWTREYARIVERFSRTIAAEFNGHTHTDEFKVFYTSDNEPTYVAWNGGSMTSYSYLNVNYKVVTADGDNYIPLDIETYIYNLTEANLSPEKRPHWFMEYDFRSTFGVATLEAATISDLVYRMARRESSLLDLYAAFFIKLTDARLTCDDACRLDRLCKIVVTELHERQRCNELVAIYNSS